MFLESYVDVLIIGAGPAGAMCANALSMAGIEVRIIDKRPAGVTAGHADGVHSRTLEVLQSYQLAERLLKEGNPVHMVTFYNPGPDKTIQCTGRMPFVTDPTAPYPFLITLRQASIEGIFLDSMKAHGVQVERPKQPSSLQISEDVDELSSPLSYPVKVTVERQDGSTEMEIIHAKYVIGADGAHSWVRSTLGIQMEGEQTDYVWGVIDMVTESDFPDIRNISGVHSVYGSCLLVPREGETHRLYIQLTGIEPTSASAEILDKNSITPETLLSVSRKILHPYKLADPKEVEWYSLYTIGQRIASSYSVKDRVFIVGDACHTHSPKGAQGMNAGINDAHNLSWKLAQVLRGWSSPSLLKSYEYERRSFAKDLVTLDKEYSTLFSSKVKSAQNEDGVSPEQYVQAAQKRQGFITGLGIHYPPSAIVNSKHQTCASNLTVGQRMPSYKFILAADARPINIHDLLPADVRFKLLFFVGHLTPTRMAELDSLADELTRPSSYLCNYSTDGNISSVFDIITIIAAKKHDMNYLLVPSFFRPHWSRVLLDDTDLRNIHGGDAYEKFGIDPGRITVVVVRPDGYVGMVVPFGDLGDLEGYLGSFLVSRGVTSCQCGKL